MTAQPADAAARLEERINRVAALRSLLFAGTMQNPELMFFEPVSQ